MDSLNFPNFPKINPPKVEITNMLFPKLTDLNAEFYAAAFYNRLVTYIIDFEETLDENLEVGVRLVSFGESIIIHVDSIGYWNPELISFNGTDQNGNKVQLIQHINQISFLLMSLPRINPERPRVGYKLKKQIEEEQIGSE